MAYRTNAEQLTYLTARIARIEATMTRMEGLGLSVYSAGGISKTFNDYDDLARQLARLKAKYSEVQSIIAGEPMDPSIKYVTISSL